jgi:hypothetical protein
MPKTTPTEKDDRVPSSKYGSRQRGRLGKTDGRNVKRLWNAMIEAGAVAPDGDPLSTRQIAELENQPFEMHRLSNHLSKKPHLFVDAGSIRVAGVDGRSKYPQKTWLAKPDGYESDD